MTNHYDVIVVGAGTSGLMAAIQAAQQGAKVLILEKNKVPGRKLLLSGGGRCNVTNRTQREELIRHIPGNGKFLYSALNQFDQEDIIAFFETRGVPLKEEDHGRMFPVSDRSRTILDTLLAELDQLGVTIYYQNTVQSLKLSADRPKIVGVETQDGQFFACTSLVLAMGGRAYPKTGSTGDGYALARSVGHSIRPLYPTEASLISTDREVTSNELKGISIRNVRVSLWDDAAESKEIIHHQMDMIFTHFGYSGPAILRCSGHVNLWLADHPEAQVARLSIDLVPEQSIEDLCQHAEDQRDKHVLTLLKNWMPERMAQAILHRCQILPDQAYKQLEHQAVNDLWQTVKHYSISATGSQPIEKGFVTGGGISVKEVEPKSMASKLVDGLYFCGELLDINGYPGGYNITAAFVTGSIAGQYATWAALSQ